MNNLVVIPFHDYKVSLREGFRTRDAHLYEHFMKNHDLDKIVIVNRPTSLAEVLLKRKKIRTLQRVIYKNDFCYLQQLNEKVYIIDFFVFDFLSVIRKRHAWLPFIYSKKKTATKIKQMLDQIGIQHFGVYMSAPFSVETAMNLKADVKVLDAVDNFAKYKNWNYFNNTIVSLYETAKQHFDFIFVNSQDTYNYLKPKCKAFLKLEPNGVDFDKFHGTFPKPADIPSGKIVGYAGKIQRMFNAGILMKLAKTHPDVHFVLIGKFLDPDWKKKHWINGMSNLKNIHFLGDKQYNTLPAYYHAFNICIIPYYIEEQHGGDPIKFYEYMACNKPIVSTDIGNIKKYNNDKSIFICKNEEEFIEKTGLLISQLPIMNIQYELPSEITWEVIASGMIDQMFKFHRSSDLNII